MKNIVLLRMLLILLIVAPAIGQKENYNWYFGYNTGITFMPDGNPKGVPVSSVSTWEGCATISDSLGNLLFYTDGSTVYSSNHSIMQNGTDLYGYYSSTSSAVAVPRVGYPNEYYLFTMEGGERNAYGLCYSIIDMNKNGGLGEVTVKNVPLLDNIAETLTAVYHRNGRDIWIVVFKTAVNMFYSYLVSPSGVSAPVTSKGDNQFASCYLRFSPDRTKLATTSKNTPRFLVFDYDNSTGIVSNPLNIRPTGMLWPYGVEFSPDGTKLYGTCFNPSRIYQFDLTLKDEMSILNQAVELTNAPNFYYWGALQRGPDGRIYSAILDAKAIAVINDPNAAGLNCGYLEKGVPLITGKCGLGLPTFLDEMCNYDIKTASNEPLCSGDSLVLRATSSTATSYLWTGPNGFVSNLQNPVIKNVTTANAGIYHLKTDYANSKKCPTILSEINIRITDFPDARISPRETVYLCEGDSVKLTLSAGNQNCIWSNGSSDSFIYAKQTGVYKVIVFQNNCRDSDSVSVIFRPKLNPKIIAYGNTLPCKGDSLILMATPTTPEYIYKWSTGSTENFTVVRTDGVYSVTVSTKYGCRESAVYKVYFNEKPDVNISASKIGKLCPGESIVLDALPSNPNLSYHWSTDETSQKISVNKSGIYNVTVTDGNGCFNIASKTVEQSNIHKPKIILNSNGGCGVDSVLVSVEGGFNNIRWFCVPESIPFEIGKNQVAVKKPGNYYVIAINEDGCSVNSDTTFITFRKDSNALYVHSADDPGKLSFDTVAVNSINYRKIRITNRGTKDFILSELRLTKNISFSVPQSQLPLILPPGESADLTLVFSSWLLGIHNDSLLIEDLCEDHILNLKAFVIGNLYSASAECGTFLQMKTQSAERDFSFSLSEPYPNPATEKIIIGIDIIKPISDLALKVYDVFGKQIDFINLTPNKSSKISVVLDLQKYSNGIFICYVKSDNQTSAFKFSVVK